MLYEILLDFCSVYFFCVCAKIDPFSIELRPRVIDNAKVIVNIEITNNFNRPIDYLEGFLSEYSSSGDLLSEKKLVVLYSYEPALQTGFSSSRTAKFDLKMKSPKIIISTFQR